MFHRPSGEAGGVYSLTRVPIVLSAPAAGPTVARKGELSEEQKTKGGEGQGATLVGDGAWERGQGGGHMPSLRRGGERPHWGPLVDPSLPQFSEDGRA